jgi:hypothetical protein
VRDEIAKTIGYWLELGISGSGSTPCRSSSNRPRASTSATRTSSCATSAGSCSAASSDAVLLGEVNLPYDQQLEFFGATGDRPSSTMQFDFLGMQALYLSLAREDARPLAESLAKRPSSNPRRSGRTSCATTTSSRSTS